MSFDSIQPGLRGEIGLVVADEHTARHLGSGTVRVLATPQMVLLMEQASVAAVHPLLPDGSSTVGAYLEIRHLAPTPVGFEVRATAELTKVDERKLTFRVQVFEGPLGEAHLVGDGIHQRVIVDVRRFGDNVEQKLAGAS